LFCLHELKFKETSDTFDIKAGAQVSVGKTSSIQEMTKIESKEEMISA
jgi:hypothetical protein